MLDRYSGDIAAAASMPADQAVKKLADTVYSAFTETCGNSVQRGTHTGTFPEDPNTTLPEINLTGNYTRCNEIPAGLHQSNPDGFIEMDADNANPVLKSGAAANFCGPVVFKSNEAYIIDGDKYITVFIDNSYTETSHNHEHYSDKSYVTELYATTIYKTGGGAYDYFFLKGDNDALQTISDQDTIDIAGGTAITTESKAPDTVEIKLDNTTVEPAQYTYSTITVDQQGRLTAAASGLAPSFILSADNDNVNNQTIANGETLEVAGGNGIATECSILDTVTVNMDMTDDEAAWNVAQDLAISHDFDGDTKIKLFIDADAGQLAASYNAGAIQVLGHDASGDWVWIDTTQGCT